MMEQITRIDLPVSLEADIRYLEIRNPLDEQVNLLYAFKSDLRLEILEPLSKKISVPTSLDPTATTTFSVGEREYLAIAAENSEFQAFVLVYDFECETFLTEFAIRCPTRCIVELAEGRLLVSERDYVYCYHISENKTGEQCNEEFWTMAADEVLYIVVTGNYYACICQDMYLRLYDRENLIDEIRVFPRSSIMEVESFMEYISVTLESGKQKIFHLANNQLRVLCCIDDLNELCGHFIQAVYLTAKFYSCPLQYYLNTADLEPFQENHIEREMKLKTPIPLLTVFLRDGGYTIIMLNLLKNEKFELEFKPIVLLEGVLPYQGVSLAGSSYSIAGYDLFHSFMSTCAETFLETEELPFTAGSVQEECKEVFLVVMNQNILVHLEMPILLDFQEFIEAIIDAGGEIVSEAKKRRKREDFEALDALDSTGVAKKKLKKERKARKKDLSTDSRQLIELFRMRSLVLEKTLDLKHGNEELSSSDFAAIASTCIDNVRFVAEFDGVYVECALPEYVITGAVIEIDNERYNLFPIEQPTQEMETLYEDQGLSEIETKAELHDMCSELNSESYYKKSWMWKTTFHLMRHNDDFTNKRYISAISKTSAKEGALKAVKTSSMTTAIPEIVTESVNEMIITYKYRQLTLNHKAEINTSILPYLRICSVDNSTEVVYPGENCSNIVFRQVGIEQVLEFLQCCFIDYDFIIPSKKYEKINEVLIDSRWENVEIYGRSYSSCFFAIEVTNLSNLTDTDTHDISSIHMYYSRNSKEFHIYALNLRAVLIIAEVAARILKLDAGIIFVGNFYAKLHADLVARANALKISQNASIAYVAELTQALGFATAETLEKCQEKQFGSSLSGYDAIALRSIQELSQRQIMHADELEIKRAINELEELLGFFDKELAIRFSFSEECGTK